MNYLQQVRKGIDYIEANLDTDISCAEVARHAGVSHWHFQRMFKALTSETLKTYIRSRRFAGALETLLEPGARIIDVALRAGFETQESFTRAFKKAFGVTPAGYRRRGSKFKFLRKVRIDAEYLGHLHQNISLEPELYSQPGMQLVGLKTCFFGIDSEKNNLGAKLPDLWRAFLARLGEIEHSIPGICYGVVQQTTARDDELEYHACVEVSRIAAVPAGMASVRVPASRYARFTHQGQPRELDTTVNYVYSSWLARSGARHTYGPDLEFYGADYVPESDRSIIRYAIPIEGG